MFQRAIQGELKKWYGKTSRKPLIIRGARQVGKTTAVSEFSKNFRQYIYLNLELPADRRPFQDFSDPEQLIQALFFLKNAKREFGKETLIFIDEIQELPEAFQQLRYLYEYAPEIPVIAAGSMLETLFANNVSFPVGRVEYLVVRPVSFPEFLGAMGEEQALEQLQKIPFSDFAFDKLMQLFRTYCLIGGMPEVVSHYVANRDLTALGSLYESLIVSYLDDVEKYAGSQAQANYIRHAIRASFAEAGRRIKFQGFGNSTYKSREMGEALRALEKALVLHLVYPQTKAELPLLPDLDRAPRLQVLDTGLLNYYAGIQKEIIGTEDLNKVYHGTMIEHLVGQELLATQFNALHGLNFWVREKTTSLAEIDFIYLYNSKLIPVEVKAGAEGTLKSLHQFMEIAPHNKAVRFYGGRFSVSEIQAPSGKKFQLLNLPYFMVSQIEKYMEWFFK